jgi:putative transposase
MPWKETCAMDQKMKMIGDYLTGEFTISDLSEMYAVSRITIYKWIERYQEKGAMGLLDWPTAPKHHPNATSLEIARHVVEIKLKHPAWGPKKVVVWLEQHYPDVKWPAFSTASNILKHEGLVKPRQLKHRTPPYTQPFQECNRPNAVWSADYKGQFRTGDNRLCYPLTITDNYSRYLLCCRGLYRPTYEATKPWFESVFKKYGLPAAVRTDNGEPFASTGLGGLSRLSVWFIKLGIKHERIRKGHPQENGRHERMHRSLKEATAKPPKENLKQQQRAFNVFQPDFNMARPHEALEMQTPASIYMPSLRLYPVKLPEITYHGDYIIREVRHNGEIKWKGDFIYISQALVGEPIALKQRNAYQWEIRFSTYPLGILDETAMKIFSMPLTG